MRLTVDEKFMLSSFLEKKMADRLSRAEASDANCESYCPGSAQLKLRKLKKSYPISEWERLNTYGGNKVNLVGAFEIYTVKSRIAFNRDKNSVGQQHNRHSCL